MAESVRMAVCPMAQTCRKMMAKRKPATAMVFAALALIVLGIAVLVAPQVLVWLVGVALIMMGLAALMLPGLVRRTGGRSGSVHGKT